VKTRNQRAKALPDPERHGSVNAVYIPDRISHCPHHLRRNQSFRRSNNPQTKGRSIMGDKSPKAVHKQSSQKQAKVDKSKRQKQQAVFEKQSGNKKQ
jgi:hypothetical protein